jgi:hypothetical protein
MCSSTSAQGGTCLAGLQHPALPLPWIETDLRHPLHSRPSLGGPKAPWVLSGLTDRKLRLRETQALPRNTRQIEDKGKLEHRPWISWSRKEEGGYRDWVGGRAMREGEEEKVRERTGTGEALVVSHLLVCSTPSAALTWTLLGSKG